MMEAFRDRTIMIERSIDSARNPRAPRQATYPTNGTKTSGIRQIEQIDPPLRPPALLRRTSSKACG